MPTSQGKGSPARKKKVELMRQLREAGVTLTHIPEGRPSLASAAGTKLTAAALRDIETKGIEFTAWGAWTLRF